MALDDSKLIEGSEGANEPSQAKESLREIEELSASLEVINVKTKIAELLESGPTTNVLDLVRSGGRFNKEEYVELRAHLAMFISRTWKEMKVMLEIFRPELIEMISREAERADGDIYTLIFNRLLVVAGLAAETAEAKESSEGFDNHEKYALNCSFEGLMVKYYPEATDMGRGKNTAILNGFAAGLNVLLPLMEVIPKVFEKQFQREMSYDEYMKALSFRNFFPIIATWARVKGDLVTPLEVAVGDKMSHISERGLIMRETYDEDCFVLEESDSGLVLGLSDEITEFMKAISEETLERSIFPYRIYCPAYKADAEVDGRERASSTVMVELVREIVGIIRDGMKKPS